MRRLPGTLEIGGIAHLFTAIHIDAIDEGKGAGKLPVFASILHDHGLQPHEVMVVGDNPDSEIAAGNQLGMATIQTLRPGVSPSSAAAHTIRTLSELKRFL
jgi:putative hydrolase of the HAD superfamily